MERHQEFWKKHNFLEPALGESNPSVRSDVRIEDKSISIMDVDTFYREALPPPGVNPSGQSILLLHGMAFKSQTWLELGTIHRLAELGHRVVAVDLPGYGKTTKTVSGSRGAFLASLVQALSLEDTVIVSPSMSGSFALPYLFEEKNSISGYIPVAPIHSEVVGKAISKNRSNPALKIPTLIIYGELDTSLGISSRDNLLALENSQSVELPGAKHPAYLDQPVMFHTLVHNFLSEVKKAKTV